MLYKGEELIITDSAGTSIVAAAKTIDVEMEAELQEVGTTGLSKAYVAGKKTWQVSVSSLVTGAAFKSAYAMIGSSYSLRFRVPSDKTTDILSGSAICTKAKITDQKGIICKGTFVFHGNGTLS